MGSAAGPTTADADREAEVLALIQSDDRRGAIELMMDLYGDAVLRFAYGMTYDSQLADEVRQQVFIEAHRDMDKFAGMSTLLTWLIGIARHRCFDATKARTRWNSRFKNDLGTDEPAVDHDPIRDLDRDRLAKLLAFCLDKLAPAAREAVMLRYQQELSYADAAELTREQPGTLQQRVARAMPALRKCVEGRLGGAS